MAIRIFEQGNWKDAIRFCPICNSGKDGQVILIPIDDKGEGYNYEAIQVHLDCLNLWFNEKHQLIYQKCKKPEGEQEIEV